MNDQEIKKIAFEVFQYLDDDAEIPELAKPHHVLEQMAEKFLIWKKKADQFAESISDVTKELENLAVVKPLYRLKHKPTSLYYSPDRGSGNLTIAGKIYRFKPKVTGTSVTVIIHTRKEDIRSKKTKKLIEHFNIILDANRYYYKKTHPTNVDEWEVEEVKVA